MPRLHFEGLGNSRAKERVLGRLLTCIATIIETCEFGLAKNMAVGDDYPIPHPPYRSLQEERKRQREPSLESSTDSHPNTCPDPPRSSPPAPRASEVSRAPTRQKGPSQPILPPHSSLEEQRPRGGITIREGLMAKPPRTQPVLGKGKGKVALGYAHALFQVDQPSSPFMECLIADSLMFEEPLLQDPDKEMVSDLSSEFGAPVIKKVLDLLCESTPFQMVIATLYFWSRLLFLGFFFFL